jgi:FkbM family methyltransferase
MPRFVTRKINFLGESIIVPDAPSFAGQVKDIFIEKVYNFISESETPIIYDCGANIGLATLYFKRLYPRASIKAFEADTKIYEILKTNLDSYGLLDHSVILYNNAVWINDDELSFNSDGADGGTLLSENTKSTSQRVKAIRLKDMLASETEIDFLKMDIEGAEVLVLKDCGSELKKVKRMVFEYHSFSNHTPQELGEVLTMLSSLGFRYYINTLTTREMPLINTHKEQTMDMKLEVYAYKI